MPSIRQTDNLSDDSDHSSSYSDEQDIPRKRRRLSSEEDDNSPTAPHQPEGLPSLSRVNVRKSGQLWKDEDVPDSIKAAINFEEKTSFATLGVTPWLVASLANMAIKRPTGIQKRCIPEILKGRDCIGGSRTGSGKTVAFAVPILQKWAEDPSAIYAVILTPTRELALQLYEQILAISAPQSLKCLLVTGGNDMRSQAIALAQRPHVVVATPGRLADHIQTSGYDTVCGLGRCRFVVLDEADRLLAPGKGSMLPDVETCIGAMPPPGERQTCLFTATVTDEVRALKSQPRPKGREPVFTCELETSSNGTSTNSLAREIPPTLKQTYLQAPVTHRESYLHALLTTPVNTAHPAIIIFCNRTATATLLEHLLRLLEHRVTALHSGLPQHARISNLARFRARAARILVATDVAARGLDIPHVALVIHFDLPRDPDDYVHRVGRTARAGREGESVAVVGQRDVELLLAIEERVDKKMEEWAEEGVSIEGRVVRNFIGTVSSKKREALLAIEEGRDVKGKRKVGLKQKR